MKNNLVFTVGATTLITLGALGMSLAYDDSKAESKYNSDKMVRNTYQEIIWEATDNVEYQNVINAVNKKVEEDKQRELEEKRKQEELKRKQEEEEKNNLGTFNVSWYSATCKGCSGITATQVDVRNNIKYQGYTVAASDWSVIPPYSIIEVEGYGKFIIADKGGAIRGKKLDLLTSNKNTAIKNGRQYLNVKVIRWGKGE